MHVTSVDQTSALGRRLRRGGDHDCRIFLDGVDARPHHHEIGGGRS